MKHVSFFISCLFLAIVFQAKAQISHDDLSNLLIGSGDPTTSTYGTDLDADKLNAIFCEGDGRTLTLTAGADFQDTDGNTIAYAEWEWHRINAAGGGTPVQGKSDDRTFSIPLASLDVGYNVFRAYGYQNVSDVDCPSLPEDFVIFILPELHPVVNVTGGENNLVYCANQVPGVDNGGDVTSDNGEPIVFTLQPASIDRTFTPYNDLNGLEISNFKLNYKWYKLTLDGSGDVDSEALISGATSTSYTVPPTDNTVGSYKYELRISYDVNTACGPYNAIAQAGGTDATIIVTPQPGKPKITISADTTP